MNGNKESCVKPYTLIPTSHSECYNCGNGRQTREILCGDCCYPIDKCYHGQERKYA